MSTTLGRIPFAQWSPAAISPRKPAIRHPSRSERALALTQAPGYGVVAKILHWLIFLLLAVQYAIGSIMPHIGRKTLNEGWVNWHFSVGASILFFIVIRLIWRLLHPVPQLPTLAPWERKLTGFIHRALYALVLIMTLLGWAAANSRGWEVKLSIFSRFPSWRLTDRNGAMKPGTSTMYWFMYYWASSSCMSGRRCITISPNAT